MTFFVLLQNFYYFYSFLKFWIFHLLELSGPQMARYGHHWNRLVLFVQILTREAVRPQGGATLAPLSSFSRDHSCWVFRFSSPSWIDIADSTHMTTIIIKLYKFHHLFTHFFVTNFFVTSGKYSEAVSIFLQDPIHRWICTFYFKNDKESDFVIYNP